MLAPCVALLLLGAALFPGGALGQAADRRNTGPRSASAADSLTTGRGGYAFPERRDQLRVWALNATGPAAVAGNLVGASWRQWVSDEPAKWDTDGRGFAKRFGAASLSTAISETSVSLVSALMRQDAAYYRSPPATLAPRLSHALAMTFLARDRKGERVFSPAKAFSYFVGPAVTQASCYPENHDAVDVLVSGAFTLLINAGLNAAHELVLGPPAWEGAPPTDR